MSFYRFSEIEDENSNVREVLGRVFYDSKLSLLQTLADEEIFECLIIIVESIDKILEKLSKRFVEPVNSEGRKIAETMVDLDFVFAEYISLALVEAALTHNKKLVDYFVDNSKDLGISADCIDKYLAGSSNAYEEFLNPNTVDNNDNTEYDVVNVKNELFSLRDTLFSIISLQDAGASMLEVCVSIVRDFISRTQSSASIIGNIFVTTDIVTAAFFIDPLGSSYSSILLEYAAAGVNILNLLVDKDNPDNNKNVYKAIKYKDKNFYLFLTTDAGYPMSLCLIFDRENGSILRKTFFGMDLTKDMINEYSYLKHTISLLPVKLRDALMN